MSGQPLRSIQPHSNVHRYPRSTAVKDPRQPQHRCQIAAHRRGSSTAAKTGLSKYRQDWRLRQQGSCSQGRPMRPRRPGQSQGLACPPQTRGRRGCVFLAPNSWSTVARHVGACLLTSSPGPLFSKGYGCQPTSIPPLPNRPPTTLLTCQKPTNPPGLHAHQRCFHMRAA